MPENNPFAYLMPTPENLRLIRRAEQAKKNEGQDFFTAMAGDMGLKFREQLIERGRGLGPEDRRALQIEEVLGRAQKSLVSAVEAGDIDPMDAQEQAISTAMKDLMFLGDHQAAQSLLPALNQIRTYKDEQNKLRAETGKLVSEVGENEADRLNALAQAGKYVAEGDRVTALTPSEIADREAQAFRARQAGLLDQRTDPNLRAGGKSGGFKVGTAAQDELRAASAATASFLDNLNELSGVMSSAPEAASFSGQQVNIAGQYLSGMRNFFLRKGTIAPDQSKNLTDEQQQIADAGFAQRAAQARSLGMNVTVYNSMVIDTAYAMARAMDPGGRLSNNDFAYALSALGAVQDARSAKAAFASLASRAHKRFKDKQGVYDAETQQQLFAPAIKQVDDRYSEFNKLWGTDGSGPGRSPSGPGTETPEQRRERLRKEYVKPK